jgi:hypothetical protein
MKVKEKIRDALLAAQKKQRGLTDLRMDDISTGLVGAYEYCLELMEAEEKVEAKAMADLKAAAIAVLDMEYERVNADGGEPYYPLANPGHFDPRVVALAQLVSVDYLNDTPKVARQATIQQTCEIRLLYSTRCMVS